MENRTRLRVHKPKAFKNGKKHLVKRVFDFLKSDTFFYAPLLSNVPSHFLSPDFLPSPTKGRFGFSFHGFFSYLFLWFDVTFFSFFMMRQWRSLRIPLWKTSRWWRRLGSMWNLMFICMLLWLLHLLPRLKVRGYMVLYSYVTCFLC